MPSILRAIFDLFHIKVHKNIFFNSLDIIIKIVLVLLLVKIIIKVVSHIIENFFERQKKLRFGMSDKKADTLSELLKSILGYGVYFIAIIIVFETVWPNINATIAFTSVLGVAVGFGSQNLVKDIISGFFILFEDQFAVGDYVVIDGKSGIVEALGIRTTKIKDFSGELHTIPNGSISGVTNKSRSDMRALVEVNLAFDEDIDKAIGIINKVLDKIEKEDGSIVEGPDVVGVVGINELGVIIRITAKTYPMKQFDVECKIRKGIIKEFQSNNIKFGYNKKIAIDGRGAAYDK